MIFFYFFTLKNQALDPDPYPDPHSFSKPWIRIRSARNGCGSETLDQSILLENSFVEVQLVEVFSVEL